MCKRKNIIGVTLIELMLSLLLSLLIMSAIGEIYLAVLNSYLAQQTLLTVQENAQLTSELLTNQIRMAGYVGCAKLTDEITLKNNGQLNFNLHNKLASYKDPAMKAGTDAISFWQASQQNAVLIKNMLYPNRLLATAAMKFSAGEQLIISDCKTVELFSIKKILVKENGQQEIIPLLPLHKLYKAQAEINKLEFKRYFIGKTGRLDYLGQPIYALYQRERDGRKVELVESIEAMEIYFTKIVNGRLVEYPADAVISTSDVVGVGFAFMLSSLTKPVLHKKWYTYVALREA